MSKDEDRLQTAVNREMVDRSYEERSISISSSRIITWPKQMDVFFCGSTVEALLRALSHSDKRGFEGLELRFSIRTQNSLCETCIAQFECPRFLSA